MTDSVPRNTDKGKDTDPMVIGILKNDPKVIQLIYNKQFGKIKSMVTNFHHLNLDAEDVFQEGLTRAIINVRNGSYKGSSAFPTYLFSICQNICLKQYHKNKKLQTQQLIEIEDDQADDHFELLEYVLLIKSKLDDNCRLIIEMRFGLDGNEEGTRFDEIAERLGIKPANARQRFGRCFAKLLEMLKQKDEFKLLTR